MKKEMTQMPPSVTQSSIDNSTHLSVAIWPRSRMVKVTQLSVGIFPWSNTLWLAHQTVLQKDFVYEFKSTERSQNRNQRLKQANTQADLYGLFFRCNRKRVQVYCFETKEIITNESAIDIENAEHFLKKFSRLDNK